MKIGEKACVRTLFSAPNKLASLCAKVNSNDGQRTMCEKKHEKQHVKCMNSAVYEIPLSCGRVYVVQTSRCVNERLRERAYTMRTGTGSNLAIHCKKCEKTDCYPKLKEAQILKRYRDARSREILRGLNDWRSGRTMREHTFDCPFGTRVSISSQWELT